MSRERVASDPRPCAVVLTCADARLPPEIIFDQGLGDLFTCRVAGNIADPATVGSIEFAIERFRPQLIVVLGHDQCAAVATTIEAGADSALPGSMGALVAAIRPAIARLSPAQRKEIGACVTANARYVADQLDRSPMLREVRDAGRLGIVPAVYRLRSGIVDLL